MKIWCNFFTTNPRGKLGVKVISEKSMELQGRGVTTGHHLPCGGEGKSNRIKTTSYDRETSDDKEDQTQENGVSGKSNG